MAYRSRKSIKKVEIDSMNENDNVIIEDKKNEKVEAATEMINLLKEKILNGTITDGEAAEYRSLISE